MSRSTVGPSAPTQSLDSHAVENAFQDSGSSPPKNLGSVPDRGNVLPANNLLAPLRGDFSAMARRRFQNPKPFREGNWWWIRIRQDVFTEGRLERKQERMKVCPASVPEREARKIASEMLRPMNQGLQTIGSATRFADYVNGTYRPVVLPLLANTTKASYAQHVPESQRRAVTKMMDMVESRRVRENVTLASQNLTVLDGAVIKTAELSA